MKQFTRNTIKALCLGIILGASSILSSVAQTTVNENEKLIPFGDFNRWMVRVIDESFVIGGNTKILYEGARFEVTNPISVPRSPRGELPT